MTRHVASNESGDMSPQSKPGHRPEISSFARAVSLAASGLQIRDPARRDHAGAPLHRKNRRGGRRFPKILTECRSKILQPFKSYIANCKSLLT